MPAIKNGAELVKRLKASGTKDPRLAPARAVLARVKAERNEVANSGQVIAALEEAFGADHMTVVKAKAIAATGEWTRPTAQTAARAIEEELLGGTVAAEEGPKADKAPEPKAAPKADESPGAAADEKPEVKADDKGKLPAPAPPPVSEVEVAPQADKAPPKPPKTVKALQSKQVNAVKPFDVKPHDAKPSHDAH